MFTIFLGLTPFIFITFLGFVFGKLKVLDLSHAKILNLFLFYIAVPALIIKLIAENEIGQVDFKQIFSYLIMQSICGIIAYLITSKYFKRSIPESIIWALTVALSNHVTLLLPITEIYFQQNVITQVASIILMDGIILFWSGPISSSGLPWRTPSRSSFPRRDVPRGTSRCAKFR